MSMLFKIAVIMAEYWWVFGLMFAIAGGLRLFFSHIVHIQ